ncbi:FAD-binding oxidoreductase [Ramlibacter sp. RBP-2]|uniref:FAD-binding oxidoreductase n=1 Tax=Ramlibacter lithotrophicus TaxID=2606681 RepID=A0A7X6DL25_9BURK|nr:FAD-binding oxidoreductase [Ramlibacter lithotrophicus]NKE69064.1 FAD-binding oxidoreductase [Ramlibacter lithotrophicus]
MNESLLGALRRAVGESHVLTGDDCAPFLTDWRKVATGRAVAVVRPATTEQVRDVVRACVEHGAPIVPQGGNTGQVAGATPDQSGRAVVIQLGRMNRIRSIDTDNNTLVAEAGCVLQAVQEAARAAGRLFPLSLGAEGTCMIGGNLATNAGGTQVLRYGNARELTLGLEVVTAEGEVWNGLRALRKDNTGYDLRDLYIGSEGTLGIITAAALKLFPLPAGQRTAFAATASIEQAVALLARARSVLGAELTGFELMSSVALELVPRHFPDQRLPLPTAPWFVLLESSDAESELRARDRFDVLLSAALEAGEIDDAAIAESVAQSQAFWHLRESITLAVAAEGRCAKHDISIPTSRMADFVTTTDRVLQEQFPGVRSATFGHLGDGNLHYNILQPVRQQEAAFAAVQQNLSLLVHDRVRDHGGSISAEQGIGGLRTADLQRYEDPVKIALLRRIKQALDPRGLMNPGKVLPHQSVE